MTELNNILKAHEARLSAREGNTNEGAFNARSKGRYFKQGNTKSRVSQGKK